MKPQINSTSFGSITIDGIHFDHDMVIHADGSVEKRNKKLSKEKYGTSHIVSREEVALLWQHGVKTVIVGTGQYGQVELSDEASSFLMGEGCKAILLPTPSAIERWNVMDGKTIGLFHVTC